MTDQIPACLYCDRTEDETPLVCLRSHGQEYWICPQHLPILIHQPAKLAGKLPGVEGLSGAVHDHE